MSSQPQLGLVLLIAVWGFSSFCKTVCACMLCTAIAKQWLFADTVVVIRACLPVMALEWEWHIVPSMSATDAGINCMLILLCL